MITIRDDLRWAVDPVAFANEGLGFTLDAWQAQVLRSTQKQSILNCSRQSGKSTTAAILGVHRAIYHPHSLILLISPSLRQSSELFRKANEFLRRIDSASERVEDTQLTCTLSNASRVVSLPSSAATVRGFSAVDLVVEDEAARVPEELYRAIRPMLAVSGGQLILMSTPAGRRGHFFEAWNKGGEGWERVEIRATECSRITADFLASERANLGDRSFAQEYLCEFIDSDDSVFGFDIVTRALSGEVKPLFEGG